MPMGSPFGPLNDSYSPPTEALRHFTNRVTELEAFGRALAIPCRRSCFTAWVAPARHGS